MANTMKKTTTASKKTEKVENSIVNNVEKTEVKNTEAAVEDTIKKYEPEEMIPCKSITNGLLLVDGDKSGRLYRWGDYGDIEDIEYRDLVYMVSTSKSWVMKPRFIIQDSEFVEQSPKLQKLYKALYSTKDLKEILALPESQMKDYILDLPDGAKEALLGVAASCIANGTLDSVKKIKIIDEIFDTELLLTLVQE